MKKRKTLACPRGLKFGKDFNNCSYGDCRFYLDCADRSEELEELAPPEDNDNDNNYEPEDESQSKKHKKKKQDNRGLYIPRPALNKLLNVTYHTCVRHYIFYLKEGIRQKTNRPYCNPNFTAKGLSCSPSTVETAKTALVKAGFIKKGRMKRKDGKYGKSYIELKYYPTKFVIEKAEYKRRLEKYKTEIDEMVEEGAYWINLFTSEKAKREVIEAKYKDLRRKYRKLKRKNK